MESCRSNAPSNALAPSQTVGHLAGTATRIVDWPQISTSLFSMLWPHSHATYETFEDVTLPKISLEQARVTTEFSRVGSQKGMCTVGDMSCYFKSFLGHTGGIIVRIMNKVFHGPTFFL